MEGSNERGVASDHRAASGKTSFRGSSVHAVFLSAAPGQSQATAGREHPRPRMSSRGQTEPQQA